MRNEEKYRKALEELSQRAGDIKLNCSRSIVEGIANEALALTLAEPLSQLQQLYVDRDILIDNPPDDPALESCRSAWWTELCNINRLIKLFKIEEVTDKHYGDLMRISPADILQISVTATQLLTQVESLKEGAQQ